MAYSRPYRRNRRRLKPVERALVLMVILAALGVAALTWKVAVDRLTNPTPVKPAVKPAAFVWGNLTFMQPAPLSVWLHDRGRTYSTWAKRHPAGLAIFFPAGPASRRQASAAG